MAVKTLTQVSDDLKPLMLQDLRIQCRARGISPAGSRSTLLERLAEHMMATDNYSLVDSGGYQPATADVGDRGGNVSLHTGDRGLQDAGGNNYGRPEGQNVGNFLSDRPSSRVLAPPGGASQVFLGSSAEAGHQQGQRHASTPAYSKQLPWDTEPEHDTPRAPLSDFQRRAAEVYSSPPPAEGPEVGHDPAYPPPVYQVDPAALKDLSNHDAHHEAHPSSQPPYYTAKDGEEDAPHHHYKSGQGCSGNSLSGVTGKVGAGGNNYSRPEGQNVGNFLSDRPSSRVLAPPGGASQVSFG